MMILFVLALCTKYMAAQNFAIKAVSPNFLFACSPVQSAISIKLQIFLQDSSLLDENGDALIFDFWLGLNCIRSQNNSTEIIFNKTAETGAVDSQSKQTIDLSEIDFSERPYNVTLNFVGVKTYVGFRTDGCPGSLYLNNKLGLKILDLPQIQIYPSALTPTLLTFENPNAFEIGGLQLKFKSDCAFLPKIAMIRIQFQSAQNTKFPTEYSLLDMFDINLCNVLFDNNMNVKRICSKQGNEIKVYNFTANENFSFEHSLQIFDVVTPPNNYFLLKVMLFSDSENEVSKFAEGVFELKTLNPKFELTAFEIKHDECKTPFILNFLLTSGFSFEINSEFSIEFSLSGKGFDPQGVKINSPDLAFQDARAVKINGLSTYIFDYKGLLLKTKQLRILISGFDNPENPGNYTLNLKFVFDKENFLLFEFERPLRFVSSRIPELEFKHTQANNSFVENFEISIGKQIFDFSQNGLFALFFDNCCQWTEDTKIILNSNFLKENEFNLIKSDTGLGISGIRLSAFQTKFQLEVLNLQKKVDFESVSSAIVSVNDDFGVLFTQNVSFEIESDFKNCSDFYLVQGENFSNLILDFTCQNFPYYSSLLSLFRNSTFMSEDQCLELNKITGKERSCGIANISNFTSEKGNKTLVLQPNSLYQISFRTNTSLIQESADIHFVLLLNSGNGLVLSNDTKNYAESHLLTFEHSQVKMCKTWSFKFGRCLLCFDQSYLDANGNCQFYSDEELIKRNLKFFSLNLNTNAFVSKLFYGLLLNALVMIFVAAFVVKKFFQSRVNYVEFFAALLSLFWLLNTVLIFIYSLATPNKIKLYAFIFAVISLILNAIAQTIIYLKLKIGFHWYFNKYSSVVIQKTLIFSSVMANNFLLFFIICLPNNRAICNYFFDKFVGQSSNMNFKTMNWQNIVFHLLVVLAAIAYFIFVEYDALLLFSLICSAAIAAMNFIMLLRTNKSNLAYLKNNTVKFTKQKAESDTNLSEIDRFIDLELKNETSEGPHPKYAYADYMPLKQMLEKMQKLHFDAE